MNPEKTVLGIELGSTRIKAVLIDESHVPVASGFYEWENQLVNGVWTYPLEAVRVGLQSCFAALKADVKEKYGLDLTTVGAIGVSAMMHGYLVFDAEGGQLAEFRTWRNRITGEASEKLSALFGVNVPQRWSVAHLYQAMLNREEHVGRVASLTTLAGYIHRRLTGENVVGIGEASGMFPVDSEKLDYNEEMLRKFKELTGVDLRSVLPRPLPAGETAGYLTEDGARFLDPSGTLRPGIPFAPCEGDAGTGMIATNSVRVRTGSVSAGTSIFAMIVTDRPVGVHREIDMVTTPDGFPVALVQCNNCTSDINAWVALFTEFCVTMGMDVKKDELFAALFHKALVGEADCGGLGGYNYFSGEGVTDLTEGRPLFARMQNARFTLANFMRTHLLSALASLKIGLDILTQTERVPIDRLCGHGGFFRTPEVGQRMLSAAVGAPVTVMETAGEGGPYGMALLAAYTIRKEKGETLPDYLDNKAFAGARSVTVTADAGDAAGFDAFLARYKKALPLEKKATEVL
jgi:sugar (pentulose or hexulose) kinase